jgi:hypothetical protein
LQGTPSTGGRGGDSERRCDHDDAWPSRPATSSSVDRVYHLGRSHCHWLHAERRGERFMHRFERRTSKVPARGVRVASAPSSRTSPGRPAEGPSRAVRQCMLAWLPSPLAGSLTGGRVQSKTVLSIRLQTIILSAGQMDANCRHVWPMVATSPTTVPDARTLLHGGSLGHSPSSNAARLVHDRERQRNHNRTTQCARQG